ncbi:MAG TPA: VOC family protein [Anaerolineae bacterium]|nr:VOC family protein [Anaerolineae bacterium]
MSIFKRVEVVAYNVTNWEQAKKFYGETLGLPVAFFVNDEIGWMEFGEKDDTHLAIQWWREATPIPPRAGGATAVLAVEDAFKAVAELRQRGVRCEDVEVIPGMTTYATFYDPEGNRLQLAGPAPAQ